MKRIILFLATNLAILVVLSIVLQIFGVDVYGAVGAGNIPSLLIFAAVFGFGGSFLSLAISRWIAKKSMGVRVIDQPRSAAESWLVNTVAAQAKAVGIGMPEVGVFDSPEPNAFATGPRRDAALVAVSTGLLHRMNEKEVEAVLGHEVSHVANGDMVTLTLIQGVTNTFVIFFSRILGGLVDSLLRSDEDDGGQYHPGIGYFISVIFFEIILGFLASLIVMWFSRQREFRADRGGAHLAGTGAMISALERLKSAQHPLPAQLSAFGIASGRIPGGFARLLMSHPPLDERIAALRASSAPLTAH